MSASVYSPATEFAKAERAHLAPLIEQMQLRVVARHASFPAWAAVDCTDGSVVVRFEYERGLIALAVGSSTEQDHFWPVEHIAELFPRIRLMPGGIQRLSINEQATFLLQHFQEIKQLLGPESYHATRERLQRAHS